jgi:hypothetical protein
MLAWGQLIAHDVGDLAGNGSDPANIPVPTCDKRFDPQCLGGQTIPFPRGVYVIQQGGGPRELIDGVSHFIDASWLYGNSNMVRDTWGGHLLLPDGDFPLQSDASSTIGYTTSGGTCKRPIVSDMRAPENLGLVHMYILFGREHNRIADQLNATNPGWNDNQLFLEARKRVIALVQKITAEEYAPALLGWSPKGMGTYNSS